MKNESILNSPVEVENENDVFVSLQLSKTFIQDDKGEREVNPDICLLCKKREQNSKQTVMLFSVEQVNKLIRKLTTLKEAAISYNKARLSND